MNQLERELLESGAVPTLPTVAQRILELVRDERTHLAQLASVISCDPSLTGRVLGLINSPMYRMNREIVSLREAVLYLGMNAVRSVALSFSLISGLRGGSSSAGIDQLWHTSLMNALVARRLAAETGGWDPEEAFLAGIIADSGALLMYKRLPHYADLVQRFLAGEADLIDLERAGLETDHARLTHLLVANWNFPAAFCEVLAAQHDPGQLEAGSPAELHARILNAAWICARALTVPGFAAEAALLEHRVALLLGLAPPVVRMIASEVPDELRETARFFEIPMSEQKSFEELLEGANRALGSLALAIDRAATPAPSKLAEESALSGMTAPWFERDGHSRLASRASFERILEVVYRRARETRSSLAVVLLDFSELKQQAGEAEWSLEQVLETVGARAEQALRPTDRVARFGIDRIALLLPGCPTSALRRTAARVQQKIERQPVETDAGAIECRPGIGAAATTPDRDGLDLRTLLALASSAADRALATADRIVIAT